MDTMRCILYLHGGEDHHLILGILAYSSLGGYYFGSVDQERFFVVFTV